MPSSSSSPTNYMQDFAWHSFTNSWGYFSFAPLFYAEQLALTTTCCLRLFLCRVSLEWLLQRFIWCDWIPRFLKLPGDSQQSKTFWSAVSSWSQGQEDHGTLLASSNWARSWLLMKQVWSKRNMSTPTPTCSHSGKSKHWHTERHFANMIPFSKVETTAFQTWS